MLACNSPCVVYMSLPLQLQFNTTLPCLILPSKNVHLLLLHEHYKQMTPVVFLSMVLSNQYFENLIGQNVHKIHLFLSLSLTFQGYRHDRSDNFSMCLFGFIIMPTILLLHFSVIKVCTFCLDNLFVSVAKSGDLARIFTQSSGLGTQRSQFSKIFGAGVCSFCTNFAG